MKDSPKILKALHANGVKLLNVVQKREIGRLA